MKKTLLSAISIIIIHININAQFLDYIQTPKKNVAYFEMIILYKNLVSMDTLSQKTVFSEQNNTLYVNDSPFTIIYKNGYQLKEANGEVVDYTCLDKNKKEYTVSIYYVNGMSVIGNITEKNTDMRFGFKLEITKNW